jgi:hypothetical protein
MTDEFILCNMVFVAPVDQQLAELGIEVETKEESGRGGFRPSEVVLFNETDNGEVCILLSTGDRWTLEMNYKQFLKAMQICK